MRIRRLNQAGQTLIEVVVGIAILSLVMSSATRVAVTSSRASTDSYDLLRAHELADEGLEAMRNYRDAWILSHPMSDAATQAGDWLIAMPNSSTVGRVSLDDASEWQYDPALGAETIGKFTRRIWVDTVTWSGGDTLTSDKADGRRKQVTSEVSWVDQDGVTQSVNVDTILVDYQGILKQ